MGFGNLLHKRIHENTTTTMTHNDVIREGLRSPLRNVCMPIVERLSSQEIAAVRSIFPLRIPLQQYTQSDQKPKIQRNTNDDHRFYYCLPGTFIFSLEYHLELRAGIIQFKMEPFSGPFDCSNSSRCNSYGYSASTFPVSNLVMDSF